MFLRRHAISALVLALVCVGLMSLAEPATVMEHQGGTGSSTATVSRLTTGARAPQSGDACAVGDVWHDTDAKRVYHANSCTVGEEDWGSPEGVEVPTLDDVIRQGRRATSAETPETGVILDGVTRWKNPTTGPMQQCVDNEGTVKACDKSFGLPPSTVFELLQCVDATCTATGDTLHRMSQAGVVTYSGVGKRLKTLLLPADALKPDGTQCTASDVTINSGPLAGVIVCADNAASIVYSPMLNMPKAWDCGAVFGAIVVADVDSSSHVFTVDFSSQVRNGAAISSTWGTASSDSTVTMATAHIPYVTSEQSFTANGTCTAASENNVLFVRAVVDAAGTHTDANARVLGLRLQYYVTSDSDL